MGRLAVVVRSAAGVLTGRPVYAGGVKFRCNICDAPGELAEGGFARDEASCGGCGSTVRLRALMRALSVQLFGIPLALADFPVLRSVRGLGLSDDVACARVLAARFDYRNTFYHQPPHFDITAELTAEAGTYDFVISGDVFEHVGSAPAALRNARLLLKPQGFLAMTVPYLPAATTGEHFPDLYEYGLVKVGASMVLVNRMRGGELQVFDGLVFHGGQGATLEMRVFGEQDLRRDLEEAGFPELEFAIEDYAPFGIVHRESWSLPVIARRGPYPQGRDAVAELAAQCVAHAERGRRAEAEEVRLGDLCCELNGHLEVVNADLRAKAEWAMGLQEEARRGAAEIARLQAEETRLRAELESAIAAGQAIESELRGWAAGLETQVSAGDAEIQRLQGEFQERTEWALKLRDELSERTEEVSRLAAECELLKRRLNAWEASRWAHLGRALGAGPQEDRS